MTPTPSSLGRFQDGFARALISIEPPAGLPPEMEKVARQIAFSVYRNTVLKGWIDALKANFPAVDKLVGDEWFELAAAVYARHHPPRDPVLALFGEGFSTFLDGFEPARETPYLSAVARLDRLWSESHAAPDAAAASPEMLAQLDPQRLFEACAVLHPSVRIAWFEHTAPTIWLEARGFIEERETLDFEQVGEGVLIARPDGVVDAMPLSLGGYAFLSACGEGRSLGQAAEAALRVQPDLDLAGLLAALLEIGAVSEISPPQTPN